jgi:hypothetical protein
MNKHVTLTAALALAIAFTACDEKKSICQEN